MNLASRAELVKGNIFKDWGTTIGFARYKLVEYICKTGVSEKSSVIQKVISYMKKNDHLVVKNNGLHYIRYRRKEKANPKGIPNLVQWSPDSQHNIVSYACEKEKLLYPVLLGSLIQDMEKIKESLQKKGSCIIKFKRVG